MMLHTASRAACGAMPAHRVCSTCRLPGRGRVPTMVAACPRSPGRRLPPMGPRRAAVRVLRRRAPALRQMRRHPLDGTPPCGYIPPTACASCLPRVCASRASAGMSARARGERHLPSPTCSRQARCACAGTEVSPWTRPPVLGCACVGWGPHQRQLLYQALLQGACVRTGARKLQSCHILCAEACLPERTVT